MTEKASTSHSNVGSIFTYFIAPLLFGIYPAYYYYTKNAKMILIPSLGRVLGVYLIFILLLYLLFLFIHRFKAIRAANSTVIVLFFFNTYGIIFSALREADIVRIEHITLLPFYLFLSAYAIWLVSRIKKKQAHTMWRWTVIIFSALLAITTLEVIPREAGKIRARIASETVIAAAGSGEASDDYPDIYYILLDEFAGFRSMREYWGNTEVNDFKAYLQETGFFVAEEAVPSSIHTVHQMAVRMNYEEYDYIPGNQPIWHQALAHSRGFALLESKGYTTLVFEEISKLHQTLPDIEADYLFKFNYQPGEDYGHLFDEYGMLVADGTMLSAFSKYYKISGQALNDHRNFLLLVQEELPSLEEYPAPRFVYAHLMIPHTQFLFTKDGDLVDPGFHLDWTYYEGYHAYAIKYAEQLISGILANADPDKPPVIILQSDHGARIPANDTQLKNFPPEFKRDILYALYLPGYDISTLPQDINPINTLPLVFNHYLGENIPLQ